MMQMREMKKLGELGDVFIGLTYKPEDVVDEDGTIVLRSSNIQDGKLDFGDIVRVSCNIRDKLWVKENDILMCSRNGSAKLVGKTALISNLQEDMTFGAFMTIIRTPYNGYLQYFFKSPMFRRQLNSSATTTINQITRSMLDNIDVPVFDNDTADNIKAILCKCEKIIQERKVEINALDDLIKARFVEMFGELKPTVTIARYIAELRGGKSLAGTEECKNKVLKTGAATFGWFDPKQYKYLPQDYEPLPEHRVETGDVIISRMNTPELVGACSYVFEVPEDMYYPDRLWKVILQKETNPIFLWQLLWNREIRRQIKEKSGGTSGTMHNISKSKLLEIKCIDAPIELQEQFADFVHQVDKSKVV